MFDEEVPQFDLDDTPRGTTNYVRDTEAVEHARFEEESRQSAERLKLKLQIEQEQSEIIETATKETRQFLVERLKEDLKGKSPYDLNFDHYFLALGDEGSTQNQLLRVRFVQMQRNGELQFMDWSHQGTVAYSLLVAGADPKKKINVGRGKHLTLQEIMDYPLTHIDYPGMHDVEWVTLLAIDALRKGRTVVLKESDGTEVPLERLIATCEEEFDFVHHREKKAEYEARGNMLFRSHGPEKGSCNSTHALHALMSYALYSGRQEKVAEYTKFVFSKLDERGLNPDEMGGEEFLHSISHWLMVLCELPVNYPFTPEQKTSLKKALLRMSQEVTRYIRKTQDENLDPAIGALSHVQDVLNRIPKEWRK